MPIMQTNDEDKSGISERVKCVPGRAILISRVAIRAEDIVNLSTESGCRAGT